MLALFFRIANRTTHDDTVQWEFLIALPVQALGFIFYLFSLNGNVLVPYIPFGK